MTSNDYLQSRSFLGYHYSAFEPCPDGEKSRLFEQNLDVMEYYFPDISHIYYRITGAKAKADIADNLWIF